MIKALLCISFAAWLTSSNEFIVHFKIDFFRCLNSGCSMVFDVAVSGVRQEFFKLAPDVVERRTKGLEMYMTTLVRRFPDMLEASHLDRWAGGGKDRFARVERVRCLPFVSPESSL